MHLYVTKNTTLPNRCVDEHQTFVDIPQIFVDSLAWMGEKSLLHHYSASVETPIDSKRTKMKPLDAIYSSNNQPQKITYLCASLITPSRQRAANHIRATIRSEIDAKTTTGLTSVVVVDRRGGAHRSQRRGAALRLL
jgi:hypothetical protein